MNIATPVDAAEKSAPAWGRAHWVAVADVTEGAIRDWQVHEVSWDDLHDAGTHGSHHARIVTFLKEQQVEAIVVDHVGEGMQRMLSTMGIPLFPASPGDAQASVLAALRGATS
jgi:predicted Fe-Mo cluster-binding NifX family protein